MPMLIRAYVGVAVLRSRGHVCAALESRFGLHRPEASVAHWHGRTVCLDDMFRSVKDIPWARVEVALLIPPWCVSLLLMES